MNYFASRSNRSIETQEFVVTRSRRDKDGLYASSPRGICVKERDKIFSLQEHGQGSWDPLRLPYMLGRIRNI